MKVENLKFQNYRNLKDGIIEPCAGVNIIYGDNAQGKTNLIEALWLFCGGHSFRSSKDSEVINWEKNFAKLEVTFNGQNRNQKASLTFSPGKKTVKVNGVEKKTSSSLIERYCAVVFSPEDLNLINRGPSERRKFIDSAICREKLSNAMTLSKYNRMLIQRNALLKDIMRRPSLEETLEIWDTQLVKFGSELIKARLEYVKMLTERAAFFHNGISHGSEKLSMKYVSSCGAEEKDSVEEIAEKFTQKCLYNRLNDINGGVTLAGPHRDDFEIFINGKNTKVYASQGQKRSAVLSLKLAEANVLKERMGEFPIILLDDVLSELDNERQDFLLNELKNCQVFISCCEKSNKEQLKEGKVFFVKDGEVR